MRTIIILSFLVVAAGCIGQGTIGEDTETGESGFIVAGAELGGFCGFSTGSSCTKDSDCTVGGCSSQVCQGVSEESIITTCEYRECYNAPAFGAECGCANAKCTWRNG
ncbi:MAG: eight-cysteine-cluster domain-containing protein [Candidatus Aenigmarchaeota archaeon]|nr:eight-cysteine-cluster domain-containing protein [Candidatus Aenigmarchaeota archaeon]